MLGRREGVAMCLRFFMEGLEGLEVVVRPKRFWLADEMFAASVAACKAIGAENMGVRGLEPRIEGVVVNLGESILLVARERRGGTR